MSIKISPEQLTTAPRSDKLGSLWSSFSLDLRTNEGHFRVSPRTIITTNDITDLDTTIAFQVFTDTAGGVQYAWAVSGKYVWRMNLSTAGYITAFAKDTATATPTGANDNLSCSSDESDLVAYGKTHMALTTRGLLYYYTASSGIWSNIISGTLQLTVGQTHMLCVYGARIYVTEGNTKIYSTTSAFSAVASSGSNSLNLANRGYPVTLITVMRAVSDGIWVFTINQSEDGCWAFKWDGATADDPNSPYIIPDASGVLACVIKNDTPWIIDNNADLRVFNGATFVRTKDAGFADGRLPVKNVKFLKNPLSAVNDRWIHPNGIDIVDGRIRILINNEHEDNGATVEENIASGVWEYDPQIGWVHIIPLSNYSASIVDYGQNRVSRVGALYGAKTEDSSASGNGTMLLGAQIYSTATATKEIIAIDDSNDTLQKYGYFITPKIYSQEIEDTWQSIYARFRKLLNSTDSITIKYRTNDVAATEATITWVDTNTFTSTADLAAYAVGDEVEVLQGDGAGKCAHITAISLNAGTYTVDLDDTFTGVTTNTAKARFQKWIKAGVCTDQTVKHFRFPVGIPDTWIQIKVCMQFTGKDEVDDILLVNTAHTKVE